MAKKPLKPTRVFVPAFNDAPWIAYMAFDREHVRKLFRRDDPHSDLDIREVEIREVVRSRKPRAGGKDR